MKLKNTVKMGMGVLLGRLLNKRTPLNVMLSVTNRCPSRCNYCNIPNRNQKELTTEQIFHLIDELSENRTQRLGLWGGEPLFRDDIAEIINYAKEKEIFVTLDSNGYFVPEKIDKFKNLDHLVLAFDGDEESHERNREKGSYKKVMEAIKVATRKLPVWTITVLTKYNINSIDFILDTAKKYGFLTTFQIIHHNEVLGKNSELFIPSPEIYLKAIRKLIYEKKRGAPIVSSTKYLEYILDWPDYTQPTSATMRNNLRCWAGRFYCNVDTDGSVYPCSLLIGKMKSLNFLEVGFRGAFEYIKEVPCKACLASCFTEYNYLYSLNARTIFEWFRAMRIKENVR